MWRWMNGSWGASPARLISSQAAAVPLVALTAWEGLLEAIQADLGDAGTGRRICLIVGGAGGVGSMAIQIARQVCGLQVVATASRPESEAYARQIGAHAVIDHRQPLAQQLPASGSTASITSFSTARLGNFDQLVEALNPLGKICCILGGPEATQLDVSGLFPKRGLLAFELMFTRPRTGIGLERQGEILDRVADLIDAGTIMSTANHRVALGGYLQAHRMIESGHTIGKIVLTVD